MTDQRMRFKLEIVKELL